MNDRTIELPSGISPDIVQDEQPSGTPKRKRFLFKNSKSRNSKDTTSKHDIEMGTNPSKLQKVDLNKFYGHIELIKRDIEEIKLATKRIAKLDKKYTLLLSDRCKSEKETSDDVRSIIIEASMAGKRVKQSLELLKQETKDLQAENELEESDLR